MNVLFISPPEVLYSGGSIYPDTLKFLEKAKKKYTLVALTGEAQDAHGTELEEHNLLGYFEIIASSKEYDTRLPDYRVINISLATLKDRFGEPINKNECTLVGSRPHEDIKCGNDAGIKTIRVMRGIHANADPEDDSEKPTAKVSDLKEALFLLAPEAAKKAVPKKKVAKAAPKKAKPKRAAPKKSAPKKAVAKKTKSGKAKTKAAPKQEAKPKAKRISKKRIEESFF